MLKILKSLNYPTPPISWVGWRCELGGSTPQPPVKSNPEPTKISIVSIWETAELRRWGHSIVTHLILCLPILALSSTHLPAFGGCSPSRSLPRGAEQVRESVITIVVDFRDSPGAPHPKIGKCPCIYQFLSHFPQNILVCSQIFWTSLRQWWQFVTGRRESKDNALRHTNFWIFINYYKIWKLAFCCDV